VEEFQLHEYAGGIAMAYHVKPNGAQAAISIYSSGEVIYRQGDPAGGLFSVTFGCVMLSRVTRTGNRQISGFFLPGETFGWELEPEHRFSAETVGTSSVQIHGPIHSPQAAEWRQSELVPSLTLLREQLMILSQPTADSRVAAFLDDQLTRQHSAHRIQLPMHRFDIAEYLGLSPETVSRVLRRFGLMELINAPSIHVIDVLYPEGLRKICSR